MSWLDPFFQGGLNNPTDVILVGALFGTDQNTWTRAGSRVLDLSTGQYPALQVGRTRSIAFLADLNISGGATSVEVRLIDVTHGAVLITGCDLVSTSATTVELSSGPLTVGGSAGNIRNDVATIYEVNIRMNGGTPGTDKVFCTNARLTFLYA